MKTALITGGAGRVGHAIARRLLYDGWRVLLADCDGEALREATLGLGANADAIPLDVTKLDAVKSAVADCSARHGPIAALVNAAGGRTGADAGRFLESDPTSWRPIIDLHLRGALNCCYAVMPGMIAAKAGAIVSVTAFEGLRGGKASAVFSAAKAGVVVLTETLVRECQPYGIRVNAVVPAPPEALARSRTNDDSPAVADAVGFLVSNKAARITGACLDVTGGWALH